VAGERVDGARCWTPPRHPLRAKIRRPAAKRRERTERLPCPARWSGCPCASVGGGRRGRFPGVPRPEDDGRGRKRRDLHQPGGVTPGQTFRPGPRRGLFPAGALGGAGWWLTRPPFVMPGTGGRSPGGLDGLGPQIAVGGVVNAYGVVVLFDGVFLVVFLGGFLGLANRASGGGV